MPYAGMDGEEQMPVEQTGRLCKSNLQYHKAVHGSLCFAGLEPGSDQAHIHWNAAQLERKLTPVVGIVGNHEEAEELLKYFRQG